jgi:LysM repeat protein
VERGHPRRFAADVILFIGIAATTFLLVFAAGVFQSGSARLAPIERLRALSAVATKLAEDSGGAGLPAVSAMLGLGSGADAESGPKGETLYSVQPGDTLAEIAGEYEVAVDELVVLNSIADPNVIELGQMLAIPTEAPPQAATETPQQLFAAVQGLIAALQSNPEAAGEVTTDPAEYRALQELLAMAEEELREARFDEAQHSAKAAERLLGAQVASAGSDAQGSDAYRARLEVIRATVQSAFGNLDAAQASLERALEANPDLELDPASTPRKVIGLLETIRERRQALEEPEPA